MHSAELAALRARLEASESVMQAVILQLCDVAAILDVPKELGDNPPQMCREMAKRLLALRKSLADEERQSGQLIDERDYHHKQVDDIADALGDTSEWTNQSDRGVNALELATSLRQERDRAVQHGTEMESRYYSATATVEKLRQELAEAKAALGVAQDLNVALTQQSLHWESAYGQEVAKNALLKAVAEAVLASWPDRRPILEAIEAARAVGAIP